MAAPTATELQMRMIGVQDILSRFDPENATRWFEEARDAYKYAQIQEATALKNITTRVNDALPQKKRIKVEDTETYDSYKKKLETAFEPDMKKTLRMLMDNYDLGEKTLLEYHKQIVSVIEDTDEKSRNLILNLLTQVLPDRTLKLEANKMFYSGSTTEQIATEMDKILERFSDMGDHNIGAYQQANPTGRTRPNPIAGAQEPKIESKNDTSTILSLTTDLERRMAAMERMVKDTHIKQNQDKNEIINTIQAANFQSKQQNTSYDPPRYTDERPVYPKGDYDNHNYGERTSRRWYQSPRREDQRRSRRDNSEGYYGEKRSRPYSSPHPQQYASYRPRGESRGYRTEENAYKPREENNRRRNNGDYRRDQDIQPREQRRGNRSASRGAQLPIGYVQIGGRQYQRSDVCFFHFKYADNCYPEVCKIGCCLHPSKICFYHYSFGENAYSDKCPAWCQHPAKDRYPKNE